MTVEDTVEEIKVVRQPHLAKQDASTVDASKLTALSPEVVREQETFERDKAAKDDWLAKETHVPYMSVCLLCLFYNT